VQEFVARGGLRGSFGKFGNVERRRRLFGWIYMHVTKGDILQPQM
jgi:hypothetical protein